MEPPAVGRTRIAREKRISPFPNLCRRAKKTYEMLSVFALSPVLLFKGQVMGANMQKRNPHGQNDSQSERASGDDGGQDLVETAERLVLAGLPRRLSEDALAEAVGVEPRELRRAFLSVRHCSLYSALHSLRLEEADRLFRHEASMSSEAVASHCGFGHYGVFRRNYKHRFGRDPGPLPSSSEQPVGSQEATIHAQD